MKEWYTLAGNALIVHLSGELDQHSAAGLRREVDRRICEGCNNIVFDFGELEFMDSSGIGVILGRYKNVTALGGRACVAAVRPQVAKILRLSAIDRLIPLYETVEEALAFTRRDQVG